MPQNDPLQQLQAPGEEPVRTTDGDALTVPGESFRRTPLNHTAMAFLKQSLARQQRRREVFQAQHLRVCLDRQTLWEFDPRGGVGGPFRVPLAMGLLEIFGDDAEGALLLAVVSLPEPQVIADGGAQQLGLTLEGGQTVAIDIALHKGSKRKAPAYVIQITYADATASLSREPLGVPEASGARRAGP